MGEVYKKNRRKFEQFSNQELIKELLERYNEGELVEYELMPIEHLLIGFDNSTLTNNMKLDHFRKIQDKYTLEQIEEKLPELNF